MPASPIRFHLDYLSSNAHLAWEVLPAIAARNGRSIEAVPVLFAGLLGAYGQLGPAEVPPKAAWMFKNNLRKASLLGLSLHRPAFHPFNPLLALRVSSLPMDEVSRGRLVTRLMRAVWAESRHVSEPDAKERLERQTDDALAAGVFGVPTMIVDEELFRGYDDVPYLERFLAGRDSLDPASVAEWSGPPRRSAMRNQHRERL